MEIIRELEVTKVKRFNSISPIHIILEDKTSNNKAISEIILRDEDLKEISPTTNILNKTLVVTFKSRESLLDEKGFMNDFSGLPIISLEEHKIVSPIFSVMPPRKFKRFFYLLRLKSFVGGGSFVVIEPPHYDFILDITKEEHFELKKLPVNTLFDVSFRLKEEGSGISG